MAVFLRVLRLLTMVVWVGGLIFFAFVLAPVAFSVLPSTHEAGTVVAGTLRILNEAGLICGFVFVMALPWGISPRRTARLLLAEILCCAGMMAATMAVQWGIVPRMERDRIAAGGDVDAAAPDNPARLDFERLHPISEKVEGTALLLGLAVVVLMGFEQTNERPLKPA
jgi:uncharacterized membrane protein